MGDVKSRRSYSSPLRRSQAAATRGAVLDAARDLFVGQGYGATTIEQIARRAGVSKPTVFSAVGNKQMLLRTVRDVAIAGDDEPVPIARRPETDRIREEPDRGRAIRLLARRLTDVADRYAAIYEVVRAAANSGEPELRELWETEEAERLIGARLWVEVLRAKGGPLHASLDVQTAVDMMWLLMAPDHFHRLVIQRGWDRRKYERWLTRSIAQLFSADEAGEPARRSEG